MVSDLSGITTSQLEMFADVLSDCSDAYVFIMDLKNDYMYISEQSLTIFDFPAKKFNNAMETIQQLVSPEDESLFTVEMKYVLSGKKDSFNLEFRALNRNGRPIWLNMRGGVFRIGSDYSPVLVGRISIVDEIDNTDSLTNLPTEVQLRKSFAQVWKRTQKVSGFLFKIDIDNLGYVNEQFGSHTGDFVITLVSDCVKRSCKGIAVPYKLSGDEFICMNLTGGTAVDAQKIYQNLKRCIVETEQKIDYEVVFTVSAGAVAFFNDGSQFDDLIKKINYTVTKAKEKGRNNLTLYNAVDYAKHLRTLDLQGKLRDSIKNGFKGFQLFYQPVIDAKNIYLDSDDSVTNVIGAEALLRWSCPEYGMISPEEFVPILERSGLIIPVGRWILLTGFKQCREWNRLQKKFHLSVNLSYIQVKKSDILTDVQMAISSSGVKPENITLELTESGYMDNATELQNLVKSFNELGIKVDIDDFGTGYSNLRYLQYLNASTLKLDYSFVHKATGGDEGDRKVINHITQMAHELNMLVCMEGIETEDDVKKLAVYNPDKYQGFYFGRPCKAIDFREHYIRPDAVNDVYK